MYHERAAGILSTVFGVAIVLGLLAITAHVAVGLWDRTTIESIAYEAAHEVAVSGNDGAQVRAMALQRADQRLGSRSADVEMTFEQSQAGEFVALRVRSRPIGLLPRVADRPTIVGGLDKTIRIRREQGPGQ